MNFKASSHVDELASIVWDYHLLNHELEECDCILALGSNDVRVAEHAAMLFLNGYAPRLVFTGGVGELTRGMFKASEAEAFAEIAMSMGVPEKAILLEKESTNTGENIILSHQLFKEKGIHPQKFIVVQKPFMERRAYATFKKHWPDKQLMLSSPPISYEHYPNEVLSKEAILNTMVGDLQRIKEYPARGFQIPQEIPVRVWEAFEGLVELGYTKHLIR